MLNIGMGELMVIAVLGLVVIGPERLPEVMRFLGRNYAKLKHATSDLRKAFQFEVDKAQNEHRVEVIKARRELLKLKEEADSIKDSIKSSVERPQNIPLPKDRQTNDSQELSTDNEAPMEPAQTESPEQDIDNEGSK